MRDVKAHEGTRPATLTRYQQIIDTHLVPALGTRRIDQLTPRDVQHLTASRRDTAARATLIKIHAVLRVALSDAERMELVSRNVAKVVKAEMKWRRGESNP